VLATSTSLYGPQSLAVDSAGDLYIATSDACIRKVSIAFVATFFMIQDMHRTCSNCPTKHLHPPITHPTRRSTQKPCFRFLPAKRDDPYSHCPKPLP
jgi:hypothetical protein